MFAALLYFISTSHPDSGSRPYIFFKRKKIQALHRFSIRTASLQYLIKTAKDIVLTKRFNPKTIRMSVIADQFKKGHSLQQVQYFAGHRYPSSTERYKSSHLQALQQGILKHHPLQ